MCGAGERQLCAGQPQDVSTDAHRVEAVDELARQVDELGDQGPGVAIGARGAGCLGAQIVHDGADRTEADRKSVVEGKSVSVSVSLGGRRLIKKKKKTTTTT